MFPSTIHSFICVLLFMFTMCPYLLVEGLVEEDDSGDVFLQFLRVGGEEQLSVLTAVVLVVLHVDLRQTLPHRAWKQISITASPEHKLYTCGHSLVSVSQINSVLRPLKTCSNLFTCGTHPPPAPNMFKLVHLWNPPIPHSKHVQTCSLVGPTHPPAPNMFKLVHLWNPPTPGSKHVQTCLLVEPTHSQLQTCSNLFTCETHPPHPQLRTCSNLFTCGTHPPPAPNMFKVVHLWNPPTPSSKHVHTWSLVEPTHPKLQTCSNLFTCGTPALSLTLVYLSTNMSKSVWTSGFWKPLVHKHMSNLWNNIFHKFSIPKSNFGRQENEKCCIVLAIC